MRLQARDAVYDVDAGSSRERAHWMLFASSNRAFSSTSTATCFPFSAASMSAATIGEFAADAVERHLDREHVGSTAACSRKRRTEANESIGLMDKDVPLADRVEEFPW